MKVEIRRSRAAFPAIALSFFIAFAVIFLMTKSVSDRAAVPEAVFAPPAPETVTLSLSGGEYAMVSLGAYESEADARLSAARLIYRGSAGYLYPEDGKILVLGNAYASADDAQKAVARLRAQSIPAEAVFLRAPAISVRLTAVKDQAEAFQNAWQALTRGESALFEISRRLDAGELDASAARAQLMVLTYDAEKAAKAFSTAASSSSDALIRAVLSLSDGFSRSLRALASSDDRALYLSSRVKHAFISAAIDRFQLINRVRSGG